MMKKLTTRLLTFLGIVILSPVIVYSQETLSNQSILQMATAKISADIIIEKIKNSPNEFDLSTSGLVYLTKAAVKENVIEAMFLASDELPILRNQDIVEMYQNKVSRNIILKKIQYSDCDFSTTTEGLIQLQTAKIPDAITKAMMNPQKAAKQSTNPNLIAGTLPEHPKDLPPPSKGSVAEPGIYYEEYKNKPIKYEQLEPTVTNNTKKGSAGEAIANNYTYGMVGTKEKVGLTNPSANFVIEDNRPVFYMVFSGVTRKNMNEVAESMFDGVASPNDFVLLRVKPSKRGREFVVGRESSVTSETGFSDGVVPYRYKKISNTLYKVYFEEDIPAAEYAFFYNKGSQFNSGLKLFDFSLRNNVK